MSRRDKMKKKGHGTGRFVKLDFYLLRSAAWADLSTNARALLIELMARYNGVNNGSIGLGVREAGNALNVSRNTAARTFNELAAHGFIEPAQAFQFNQTRLTREWLLTHLKDDRNDQPPRKTFMEWQPEKQNIVPYEGQCVPSQGHPPSEIGKSSSNRPMRVTDSAISAPSASHESDTYRYTTGVDRAG